MNLVKPSGRLTEAAEGLAQVLLRVANEPWFKAWTSCLKDYFRWKKRYLLWHPWARFRGEIWWTNKRLEFISKVHGGE